MRMRWICAGTLALVLLGSTAYTAGTSLYLRGPLYRNECAQKLADHLGLPADIGAVLPRSRTTRSFRDVEVWLPERRDRALHCDLATLILRPTQADPDGYDIEIEGGAAEISTRTWLRSDYRSVIESGLRPGFAPDGPRVVRFSEMHLKFERDKFRATLDEAGGSVSFEDSTHGVVRVRCNSFNGFRPSEPAVLDATFSPHESGFRVDSLTLTVPAIPLHAVGLASLAGIDARSGTFTGSLGYAESDAGRAVRISGRCAALDLSEMTGGAIPIAIDGRCPEIELQELTVLNRIPQRLRFRGVLKDVTLGELLGLIGGGGIGGRADLDVGAADLSAEGVNHFVASGECRDVSLKGISGAVGMGVMTGRLHIRINDLTIEQNRIRSLDATLKVLPPQEGESDYIEGRLLREVVGRLLNITLPPLLPERIEYSQLGLRVEVKDEILAVFGSHGDRNQTILTVKLMGTELPLVTQPASSFDLHVPLDEFRAAATKTLTQRWREWEARLQAASKPADER